jgi:UDP-N-acetylmuramate-alanine ligase
MATDGLCILTRQKPLAAALAEEMAEGDVIICMGAGSISQIAYALPEQIEAVIS